MAANDDPEARLAALGLVLPPVPTPLGTYVPFRMDGSTIYCSGQGPRKPDGSMYLGKVGHGAVSTQEAYQHARVVGLQLLAIARAAAGSLAKVQAVKVLGMVNGLPDFEEQPQVINGCSDLFVEVLGEWGRHARSAVGLGSLPGGITVEIEAIFRLRG